MKNIKGIAEYCRRNWSGETEHIIRTADMALDKTFIFDLPWDMERTSEPVHFKDEIDWLYKPGNDIEFHFQFNRHRYFVCMAQAWHLTGKMCYAKGLVEQMLDWIEKNPFDSSSPAWRTLEAGIRGDYWTKALRLIKDSGVLSENENKMIYSSLRQHMEYLKNSGGYLRVRSNWRIFESRGLLGLAVYLNDKDNALTALRRIEQSLPLQVAGDGCHCEQSQSYHNEVLRCMINVVRIAREEKLKISENIIGLVKSMAYADMMWIKPNHCQPAGGDSDEVDLRDILTHAAYLFNDPFLKFCAFDKIDFEGVWDFGYDSIADYEKIEAREPEKHLFAMDDSGHYILRSGWDEAADYIKFRCGFHGGGHGHSEQLHIDVVFGGEDILIDPGRYTYAETLDRMEYKSLLKHNAPAVDVEDCIKYISTWSAEGDTYSLSGNVKSIGEYTYFSGGSMGYCQKGVYVTRSIVAIGTRHYIIIDRFLGAGKHSYEQNYIFNGCGTITLENDVVRYQGKKAAAKLLIISSEAKAELCDIYVSRTYNEQTPSKKASVSLEAEGSASIVTVLSRTDTGSAEIKRLPIYESPEGDAVSDKECTAVEIDEEGCIYTVIIGLSKNAGVCRLSDSGEVICSGRIQVFKTEKGQSAGMVLCR